MDELTDLINALEDKRQIWPDKVKQTAGVLIGLGENGELEIHRGLVSKKEAKKIEREAKKEKASQAHEQKPEDDGPETFPSKVLEELSIHRSSATSAAMAEHIHVALCAVVHGLALQTIYNGEFSSPLDIKVRNVYGKIVHQKGTYKGLDRLNALSDEWADKTPKAEDGLWDWLIVQTETELLHLLAYVAGLALNDLSPTGRRDEMADVFAHAMKVDMAQHYKATEENLFSRLGKATLLSIIAEVRQSPVTPAEQKMKKYSLARLAAMETEGKNWLPHPLRLPEEKSISQREAG